MELPDVCVYPTTQTVRGEITAEQQLVVFANMIYDLACCDLRFSPEDACKLIMWEEERRAKTN